MSNIYFSILLITAAVKKSQAKIFSKLGAARKMVYNVYTMIGGMIFVKKFLLTLLIILLLLTVGLLFLANRYTADVELTADVALTVEEGSSTAEIASLLAENGLVRDARVFRLFARQQEVDSLFKAGSYAFAPGIWSLADVCQTLIDGGVSEGDAVRVTIREGLTVAQTINVLVEAGLGSADAYQSVIDTADFSAYDFLPAADEVIAPASRLEGFLFPDTYMISHDWSEKEIIRMLLDEFAAVWQENGFDTRAAELDMSVYDAITMASIVEKEAQVAEDRPVIAGVFYKRLEIGMNLESCATVQFLLGEPKYPLLFSDLEIVSPYNSYKNPGLPPGPIASPGLASIEAALYPTESEYLYFRAREDGSHRFSTTLSEHETYHEGDQ